MAAEASLRNEYHLGAVETSEFSLLGFETAEAQDACPQDQAMVAPHHGFLRLHLPACRRAIRGPKQMPGYTYNRSTQSLTCCRTLEY